MAEESAICNFTLKKASLLKLFHADIFKCVGNKNEDYPETLSEKFHLTSLSLSLLIGVDMCACSGIIIILNFPPTFSLAHIYRVPSELKIIFITDNLHFQSC